MSIIDELRLKMYSAKEAYSYAEYEYDCEFDSSVGSYDYIEYELRYIRKGVYELEKKYNRARELYHMALDAKHRGETVDETWIKNSERKLVEAPI